MTRRLRKRLAKDIWQSGSKDPETIADYLLKKGWTIADDGNEQRIAESFHDYQMGRADPGMEGSLSSGSGEVYEPSTFPIAAIKKIRLRGTGVEPFQEDSIEIISFDSDDLVLHVNGTVPNIVERPDVSAVVELRLGMVK